MEEIYHNYINLIISPHLDDAVFSLGGLIAKEPHKTKVVTIFTGIPQKPLIRLWDINCGFKNSTTAMKERIKENNLALSSLGLNEQSIINLPFLDIQYRQSFFNIPKYFRHKNSNEETILQTASEELKKIINNETINKIKIFAPVAFFERDHGIARDGVVKVVNQIDTDKKIELYFYQDMPYFYNMYVKKHKKELSKPKDQIIRELKPKQMDCNNIIIEIDEEEYFKKINAIKLYKSQFKMILPDPDHLFLIRNQSFFSRFQAEIYKTKTPHCEVVYKVL